VAVRDNASEQSQSQRRRRGIVLSAQGWQRLQAAELLAAAREIGDSHYTLEQLSERTGLSTKTLTKVRRRQNPVDQPTLAAYFEAFGLLLEPDDCISQEAGSEAPMSLLTGLLQTPLKGQLSLDSPFYIYRSSTEKLFAREIFQPGALIRVRAPRQYGKTSLVAQGLGQAEDHRFRTVVVSLQLADREVLSNLSQFLQWLCLMVGKSLGLPNRLEELWSPIFGSNYSCTDYFESYLLEADPSPLLLVLDEVNVLFNYPEVASDFFGMLRAWYERSRHSTEDSKIWQRLRLVIVYSTDVFLPLNVHRSPFNVGLLIVLPPFTEAQVQELAARYGLVNPEHCATALIQLLGGHPYLTQLALFHLSQQQEDLSHVLATATAPTSVFDSHLRLQLGYLEEHPDLKEAMRQVVLSDNGVVLYPPQAFKLQGVGLVRFQDQRAVCSCQLYQNYFQQLFN
jgi:transcriptional regulator with XRE-family HTH domain